MTRTARTATLSALLDCYRDACANGYTGGASDWQPTVADLDHIVEQVGRLLTRDEWAEIGHPDVGSVHVIR